MLTFIGQDGRFALANREYEQTYGWSLTELQNHPDIFSRLYPDPDTCHQVLQAIHRGDGTFREFQAQTRSGQVLDVSFANIRLSDNSSIGIGQDITHRKKIENDLKESEARFRIAIQEAPFPIIIHAEDGEILAMSRIWPEITGYQPEEIPTIADWTERAYGVRQEQIQAGIDQLYELDHRVYEGEFQITCKDGSRRIWEFSSTPLGPASDGRRIVISAAVDITERKHAEAALQTKTEELDGYFRYTLDLLCIADTDGRFRRLNKEWEAVLGYPIDEMEGQRFMTFVHPDDVIATLDALSQLTNQQEVLNFTNRYRHQDGSYRWLEWRSIPAGDLIYAAARDITERIKNEQQLRLQSAALEAAANGIVITDINGDIEWANPAFTELTGYTLDEAIGKNPRELVKSGKHDSLFYADLWQTILSGHTWRGEIVNKRKDGTLYYEELSITPVWDVQGRIAHFISVKQNITKRKQVEEAMRLSEASMATAQQAAKLGSWEVDLVTGDSVWSIEMQRLLGYDSVKVPNYQEFLERAHPEDRDRITQAYLLGKQTHEPVTFEFRTNPEYGTTRHMLGKVHLRVDAAGQPLKLTGTIQDITERKQAEVEREFLLEEVKAYAERLAQVMRSVPEGVLLLNPANQVLLANPQGQEHLALLAKVDLENQITHLGGIALDAIQSSPVYGQWHEVESNGRIFQTIAQPVETGPVPQGWVLVLRDVTEQKEVQRQLQQQERLAAIGQLAAGIAHDFNNIMAVIVLYSQILEKAPSLTTRQHEQLATITRQAKQASELIQQILDFSRRSVLAKQPLDMLNLLQTEISLLQRTLPENIEVELASKPGNYLIQADQTRLQQTIMNLSINARDAMPDGGKLGFELAHIQIKSRKHVPIPGMNEGDWIRLRITDTGSGIEPDVLEHVFEPFFTTKEPGKGTGLGLAQVHGIIAQHDGHIVVNSKVSEGTTFTIYLPALTTLGSHITNLEADALPYGEDELLLVVEDQISLREALVETLTVWQYRVLAAANGEEALKCLAEQDEPVKLVISDVVMPKMGGVALLHSLREKGWEMPVILMTGHPLDENMSKLWAQGVHIALTKPVGPNQLAQAVASALESAKQM
ncbi:MAG: PAS domain S-box protein [Ardenticatenaceae bacterium]|nr:PAS domain S-box protein [Ardenticatenaceae bacterium]